METMIKQPTFKRLGAVITVLALAANSIITSPAETKQAAIPFDQPGVAAGRQYTGDGLSVFQGANGVTLRCVFQRMEGRLTGEGLWLTSTVGPGGSEPFRVVAQSVGRQHGAVTLLAGTGEVKIAAHTAHFHRAILDEEYTVGVDGVRQDFVIEQRPGGVGAVQLELKVDGAIVEGMIDGARLVLSGGGRKLVYHRLKAQDSRGRELRTRLEIVSANRMAVVVEDATAEYPVRIDPTFSDANWASGFDSPGVTYTNSVSAAAVDASGNLYIGGSFLVAGGVVPARYIARWNGSSWSALGTGMDGLVFALVVSGNILYAGGQFTSAGGMPATNVAQWNGSAWSALGSGISGFGSNMVTALAVSGANLYAGGRFTTAGAVSATNIARWKGGSWSAVGSGLSGGTKPLVSALVVSGATLYAGGQFTTAGGAPAGNIAQWDGSSWSALGSGTSASVSALAVSGSTLYAGGAFFTAGGVSARHIAQWDGIAWSALGSGMPGGVSSLAVSGTTLYAGGGFLSAGGVSASNIAQWDGNSWSALGTGMDGIVSALAVSGKTLYAGGSFLAAGTLRANAIAQWNGGSWLTLGSGMNNLDAVNLDRAVYALAASGKNIYAGGDFTAAGGVAGCFVAVWDGNSWSSLGPRINYYYGTIYALAVSDTSLYAGGNFAAPPGTNALCVAQWNGSSWSGLGSGMNGMVLALTVSGTNLYAGGLFTTAGGVAANHIAQWNGNSWSALGSGMNGEVSALVVSGTNLYAGGQFSAAGGVPVNNVAQWNGSAWSALGAGMANQVIALAVSGTDLYAGASNSNPVNGLPVNSISRWDGSSWSAVGGGIFGSISSIATSGDNLFVGGEFTKAGGIAANNVARWDGSSWSALGSGLSFVSINNNYIGDTVQALVVSGDKNLYAGGILTVAGTNASSSVAEALLGQSTYNLALTTSGAGTNVITGLGTPGDTYALDLATNLAPPITWTPQATNTPAYRSFTFTNLNTSPQGYYRTRYVPQ